MSRPGLSGLSRETRLLAATIAVSLAVLLVLSRFRFPATSGPEGEAPAQPLARLAARAAFDDLSLAVRELTARVEGSLLAVRVTSAVTPGDVVTAFTGLADTPPSRMVRGRLVPALRVRDDLALVVAPGSAITVDSVVGLSGAADVVARDPLRGLILIRVRGGAAPALTVREGGQPPATPGYLAVAEATGAGPALRPIFVGRSDAVTDPRWDTPLFTTGRGTAGDLGAPVFMLDGRLAGVLTAAEAEPALVPAQVILGMVDGLLRNPSPRPSDAGVVTQELDEALTAATGAATGAVVVAVAPDGAAAAALQPGDVVTAIDGQPVRTAAAFRLRVARSAAGVTLALTVRRQGGFRTVPVIVRPVATVPASAPTPPDRDPAPQPLGLTLRPVDGRGSEVRRVESASRAAVAGLQVGDIVTRIGTQASPTPEQVTRAFAALADGATLFLSIEREGRPHLVSLSK